MPSKPRSAKSPNSLPCVQLIRADDGPRICCCFGVRHAVARIAPCAGNRLHDQHIWNTSLTGYTQMQTVSAANQHTDLFRRIFYGIFCPANPAQFLRSIRWLAPQTTLARITPGLLAPTRNAARAWPAVKTHSYGPDVEAELFDHSGRPLPVFENLNSASRRLASIQMRIRSRVGSLSLL